MKKLFKIAIAVVLSLASRQVMARGKYFNYAQLGGQNVYTSGFVSKTAVQRSFPGSLVKVCVTGSGCSSTGGTLIPLFSDSAGTPLPQPLTTGADASFTFWTDSTSFDIAFYGPGITTQCGLAGQLACISPFTWSAVTLNSGGGISLPFINVRDAPYNAKGNGSDDTAALDAAYAAAVALGANSTPTIIIPYTTVGYRRTTKWTINKVVNLRGEGGPGYYGPTLLFDPGIDGIELANGSGASLIQNLTIRATGKTSAATGIHFKDSSSTILRDVYVYGFATDGILIDADTGTGTNSNDWRIYNSSSVANGRDGLRVSGNNSNAGVCTNLITDQNGGYGITDSSRYANTYIGGDNNANVSGAIHHDKSAYADNSPSVFIGPYDEVATSLFTTAAHVVGGTGVVGAISPAGVYGAPGGTSWVVTLATTLDFTLIGPNELLINFEIDTSTINGNPTSLTIGLPNGWKAAAYTTGVYTYSDNSANWIFGQIAIATNGTAVNLYSGTSGFGGWLDLHTLSARGQIIVRVKK